MGTPLKTLIAVVAVAGALLVSAASPARADRAEARVERLLKRGLRAFQTLDYAEAIRRLAPIPHEQAATRAQKLDALELIAISHLILGDEPTAGQTFEDLLQLDPERALRFDDGSPKIRRFFAEVRARLKRGFTELVRLEHTPPGRLRAGNRITLDVGVQTGAEHAREMVVRWRIQGTERYRTADMRRRRGTAWRALLWLPRRRGPYRLEYYIEGRNIAGGPVGRVGSPTAPRSLRVAGAQRVVEPRWYQRWYTLAGGAAILGLGTIVVLSSGDSAPDGSLDPGKVTLTP